MYKRSKKFSLHAACAVLGLFSVLSVGCSPPVAPTVRMLASSPNCSASVSGLKLLSAPAALAEAFPRGNSLGAADYDLENVVLIAMGAKSTAGFEVILGSSLGELQDGEVVVRLAEKAPGEGEVAAQVVTHPCIAIAVSRGDYDAIRVDSSSGETLGTVEIADE